MASHARPRTSRTSAARRALARGGVVVTAAGAALGAGGLASASAAEQPASPAGTATTRLERQQPGAGLEHALGGVRSGVAGALAPAKNLQLDPLAGTGSDPLANGVGTQVGDFQPVGTSGLTAPVTRGDSLAELPVVAPSVGLLPG
jgi:hypothetical protein